MIYRWRIETGPDGAPAGDVFCCRVGSPLRAPAVVAGPEWQPDYLFEQAQLRLALSKAMAALPHRDRNIVHLLYVDEMGVKEAGSPLGISPCRVRRIHKKSLRKLAMAIHSN